LGAAQATECPTSTKLWVQTPEWPKKLN
jgi:hypothetical protein